ncbi:MAG TPA: sulfite exporter TauE/SafE family protein, partial [bacterium]|nr:sulfite exporter TauE/SafE family protein [bacterium]
AGMLGVPLMAGIFGGRPSAGLVLPMLCIADIFGVTYYHRHAKWKYVLRLMPWTIAGILIGLFVGNIVSDIQFKGIIAVIILLSVVVMIWRDIRHAEIAIPDNRWFSALMGLAGGFATMIGNSAGPIMALYFLSMHLPKNAYIGSIAWFFMIVNLLKVPLHVFFWGTITVKTLSFNAVMLPVIAVGAVAGVRVVKKIPEKPYRIFIIAMMTVAAIKMFF